jgi:hypothetical protein
MRVVSKGIASIAARKPAKARRIAANIAKLPELLQKPFSDYAELGGTMRHLRVGMCISSEVILGFVAEPVIQHEYL